MTYNQFLFNKLLCLYNKEFEKIEYDIQFEKTLKIYQTEFLYSDFYYNLEKSEYECIIDFLNDRYGKIQRSN